jgi:hypothetical protein
MVQVLKAVSSAAAHLGQRFRRGEVTRHRVARVRMIIKSTTMVTMSHVELDRLDDSSLVGGGMKKCNI